MPRLFPQFQILLSKLPSHFYEWVDMGNLRCQSHLITVIVVLCLLVGEAG